MKFNLNENESIELVYSFRSAIYFEQIAGHNVDFQNFTSNDLTTLFYTVVIASLQKERKPIISMYEFMDAIDDYNGGEKSLVEFSNWYVKTITAQYEVVGSINNEEEPKKEVKSKKKKS